MSETSLFAGTYARTYDAMYAGKDYPAECDSIEEAFRRHGEGRVRSILDLGSGTVGHSLLLALRGYEVTGIDGSGDMVAFADRKAKEQGLTATFLVGDMRRVALGRTFDAVLIMFSALGYQLGNADVLDALRSARRHLRP